MCERGSINTRVLEMEVKRVERCGGRGASVNVCPESGSCKSINVCHTVCFKTERCVCTVCVCGLRGCSDVSTVPLILSLRESISFFFMCANMHVLLSAFVYTVV